MPCAIVAHLFRNRAVGTKYKSYVGDQKNLGGDNTEWLMLNLGLKKKVRDIYRNEVC